MFLKSLVIRGFKSFAKRTNIVFEPGLSVIIGPNGSGKSNIVDAVLWVLGEQNPRFLRGKAMTDVIFSGTDAEKPAPFAEVTLTFDNSDRQLPIDSSEVSIKRRLMRDGDNTYFINDKPCRLLDVHDLILRAGLGEELPGIIPQNRLDELINPSSTDLRSIIEEASGIALYKKRKENALKRIVSVDEKIEKLSLMKREVDRELKPLKKQVEKMKAAMEIKNRLKEVWIKLKVNELVTLEERWNSLKEEESLTDSALSELIKKETDLEERKKSLEHLFSREGKIERDITTRKRLSEISEKISIYRSLLEEKGRSVIENFSRIRQQLFALESKERELQKKEQSFFGESEETAASIKQLENEEEDLRLELEKLTRLKKEENVRLGKDRQELQNVEKELREIEYKIQRYQSELSEAEKQIKKHAEIVKNFGKDIKEKAKRKSEIEKEFFSLVMKLNSLRDSYSNLNSELMRLNQEIAEINADNEVLKAKESSLQGEIEFLKSMIETKKKSQKKRIFELMMPFRKQRRALSTVLAWLAEAVQIDAREAEKIIASGGEKTGVLAINFDRNEPPRKGTLLDYVEDNEDLPDSIKKILNSYYVVKTNKEVLPSYIKNPNQGYVSEEGAAITREGILIFNPPPENPLRIVEKLERLSDDLKKLRKHKGNVEVELAKRKTEVQSVEKEVGKLKRTIEEINRSVNGLRESIAKVENEISYKRRDISDSEKEIDELTNKKSRIVEEIEKVIEIKQLKMAKVKDLEKRIDEKAKTIEDINNRIWDLKSKLDRVSLLLLQKKERKMYLENEIKNLTDELEKIKHEINTYKSMAENLDKLRRRITELHSLYQEFSASISYLNQFLEASTESSWKKFEKYKREINQIISESKEISNQKEKLLKRKEIISAQKAQVEASVSTISREIIEDSGMSVKKAIEEYFDPNDNLVDLKAEYEKLKKDLELFGDYNPLAERDYERLKSRSDFLKRQILDLQEACSNLETIVREVNRKMVDIFIKELKRVSEKFSQKFEYLFPGGEAKLNLVDPENPIDSTIEIFVRPAGKKLKRISLLSGGEKAMVALALVFAIEEVFRIPFLMLDEVESSLDEVNLNRLIHLIKDTSKRTQVIIISHQPKTIEEADIVYGVTMDKTGVSSVYCQKLKEVS